MDPAVDIVLRVIRAALGQEVERSGPDNATLARRVYALAQWHRVTAFLESDIVGRSYVEGSNAPPMAARARAITALRQLRSLLHTLEDEGIPVVPLKGPLLSARLFGDPTLRGGRDLDLLVPEDRLDDAIRLLAGDYSVPAEWEGLRAGTEHHVELQPRAERGVLVELHWGSLSWRHGPRGLDADVWASVKQRTDAGLTYLCPDPAVEAVLIATHAAGHLSHRILWLTDVAALLVQLGDPTWSRALDIAARWKVQGSTLTAAMVAARLMSVPLPDPLHRSGGARAATAEWTLSRLRAGTTVAIPEPVELIEHWRHRIGLRDGWRARLSLASRLVLWSVDSYRRMKQWPWWANPLTLWEWLLRSASGGARRNRS